MCNDRIVSIYDLCIITSLVEHSHIQIQNVSEINSTGSSAFVRTDYHHMIAVDLKIFVGAQKSFYKLISWADCLESTQWNCILYTRVMRVESDNIINTHAYQLLKSQCAVKRLTTASFVLAAFI